MRLLAHKNNQSRDRSGSGRTVGRSVVSRRRPVLLMLALTAVIIAAWAANTVYQLARWQVDPATGVVQERRDEMVAMQGERGLLRHLLRRWISSGQRTHKDRALAYTDAIIAYSKVLPDNFAGPSSGTESRALPAVWQDPRGFEIRAHRLQQAAEGMRAEIVSNGPALTARYLALHQACADCHDHFRRPRPGILSVWDRVVDWADDFRTAD